MHLFYIDDSSDEQLCAFSALALPVDQWQAAFQKMKEWRRYLRRDYGIFVYKELHAWKFVSGRGRPSDRIITKSQRVAIYREGIRLVANLPGARLFNAVFSHKEDERAFGWLLNHINRTLQAWGGYGLLICDEGKEAIYTRLVRRMGRFNPIPSQFGRWLDTGRGYRNVPIDRIVEDPFFKKSDQSYFIQLVDFVAYALLRKGRPIASKTKYGIDKAFGDLFDILAREARPRDPEGIIRLDQ